MRINDFIKFFNDKKYKKLDALSSSYNFMKQNSYINKKLFSYSKIPIKPS